MISRTSMERLARENAGQVLVAKLQARENPQSVRRFQVNRTPALVGVLNGKMETRAEAISGRDLEGHIAFLLGRGPRPEAPKATPQEASTRPASLPVVQEAAATGHRRHLRTGSHARFATRAGRFLGAVVRTLPDDGPDPGKTGRRNGRAAENR
jgi:hypothetical protein